jgi:DNA-binding NarL/FixJ family response regulator
METTVMNQIRVLLADDNEVIRRAIRQLLEEQPEITLVGEATGFAQTIQMTQELKPEVVILDLHMKDQSACETEVVKIQLNRCESRILAISIANDAETKELARSVGAFTLLDKMNLADDLIPTIKRCASWSPNAA